MFNIDWGKVTPYLDKIGDAIKTMAHGLGVGAEHVYGVLVRQEMVFGGMMVTGALLYFILLIFCFLKPFKKIYKVMGEFIALPIILLSIATAGMFAVLSVGALHLLNPEYYAMRNILEFMQTLNK